MEKEAKEDEERQKQKIAEFRKASGAQLDENKRLREMIRLREL